jgi:serine/threonine protein kinase
LKAKD